MIKHLKVALFLFLLSLPVFCFGVYQHGKKVHNLSRGNYFFSKTRESVDLSKILISFNDESYITFIKTDDLWRIKEADDYYASFSKINTLIDLIRKSVIYRADVIKNEKGFKFDNFIKIQTYDSYDNVIDEAIIAKQNDKNKYHYATLNNDNFLYQISTKIQLSSNIYNWLQMPIINLLPEDIKQVNFNKDIVYRKYKNSNFVNMETNYATPEIHRILNNIRSISAEDIRHASNFNRDNYSKVKHFVLTTFDGIIYKIDLYKGNNDFWINVALDKKLITTPEAYKKVEENTILYNGWFFKINYDKGVILSKFVI